MSKRSLHIQILLKFPEREINELRKAAISGVFLRHVLAPSHPPL